MLAHASILVESFSAKEAKEVEEKTKRYWVEQELDQHGDGDAYIYPTKAIAMAKARECIGYLRPCEKTGKRSVGVYRATLAESQIEQEMDDAFCNREHAIMHLATDGVHGDLVWEWRAVE